MAHLKDVVVTPQRQVKRSRPTAKGLGITIEKPKFPHYAQVSQRFQSYEELGWPLECPVSIENLVEAGLVYTGVGDSVRCFHCGGGLRNWETGDDAMTEHARWYPNCPHILITKGAKFVQQISNGEEPTADCADSMSQATNCTAFLDDPACLAVKEMGYDDAAVRKAIQIFQQRHGSEEKYTGSKLCAILFDMEENPDGINVDALVTENISDDLQNEDGVDVDQLAEENERLKEHIKCRICLERLGDVIFLPCGHIASCGQCASALSKCPICRKDVNGMVKAYFATSANI